MVRGTIIRSDKQRLATAGIYIIALLLLCMPSVSAQETPLLNPNLIETDAPPAMTGTSASGAAFSVQKPNTPPENADNVNFTFTSLSFTGASIINETKLFDLWPYQAGQVISVADIFTFADSVTNLYRAKGYALSFAMVPAQQIQSGQVQIDIIEGWLDEIDIQSENLPQNTKNHIKASFTSLSANRPATISALERFLLLVNDLPGISARGIISPGKTDAASSLTLIVEDNPIEGSVSYNDYLSDTLGNDLYSLNVAANGMLTGRDSLTVDASRSPDTNVFKSQSVSYDTYLNDGDMQLLLSALQSSTKPDTGTLAASNFESQADTQSIEIRKNWLRSRQKNLHFGGNITVSDSTSKTGGTETSADKTHTATLYADYDADIINNQKLFLKLSLESGLDAFNSRGNSRQSAKLNHQLLGLDGQFLRPLYTNGTDNFEADLSFKLRQMISDHAALAGAECSFGGPSFGSAFDSGTLNGENCALASLKLRWNHVLTGHDALTDGIIQFIARLDAGTVSQQGQLIAGEVRSQDAASWGIGATVILKSGFSLAIERSVQIKNPTEPKKEGKGKTNLRVSYNY